MLTVAATAVVDAATGNNGHIRALTDKKVIIHHVVKARFRQHNGNMHGFVLREGRNADVNAVLVGLGLDDDMLRVAAERLRAVGADVDRALARALHVRDDGEDLFLYLIQHLPFTSNKLQPATVSAIMRG